MQISWTPIALRDLAAIRDYIAAEHPHAAARQIAAIRSSVSRLSEFPYMGRNGRRAGTRELVVPRTPYIVAYRLEADAVVLLRVLHGRQRWPDRF